MKKTATIVLMALILIFSNCKKEALKGDKGDKGEQGPKGNANVISLTYTINGSQFTTPNSGAIWLATITELQITQDIVDNGVVLCYITNGLANNGTGNEWLQIPFVSGDLEYYFTYSKNTINFKLKSASGNITNYQQPTGNWTYKVVLMPKAQYVKNHDYSKETQTQ